MAARVHLWKILGERPSDEAARAMRGPTGGGMEGRDMKSHRPQRAFTLVELLIVIAVIAVLASLAIPSMIQSRKNANETSAVATLHAVMLAQESYHTRKPGNVYGTMDQLYDAGLVDYVVHSGSKSGYLFTITLTGGGTGYTATAEPDANGGNRHFFTDASGVIRASDSTPATEDSLPLP
jgi:type IV pilus assembly protein PilA